MLEQEAKPEPPPIDKPAAKVKPKKQKAKHKSSNTEICDLQNFFEKNFPNMRRNEITGGIELDGKTFTETNLNTILLDAKSWNKKISKDLFYTYLDSDYMPSINQIKDFFESRENQNFPTGNIKKLADCIDSSTGFDGEEFNPKYKEIFIEKWLVGAVAQVYGYVNPLLLVLAGNKQNTGKTEFYRRLCPPALQRYFTESKSEDTKESDLAMKMCESLFVYDDEMSGKNKQDQKHLKYLTSIAEFTIRKPYKRGLEKTKRLATLCGSSNDTGLLSDPTGNRRILPIQVNDINKTLYNSIDKTALFMEAYSIYTDSISKGLRVWELKKEDIEILNQNTSEFQQVDKDVELIQRYIRIPDENDNITRIERLTTTDITIYFEEMSRQKINIFTLGIKLQSMGFVQKRSKEKGIQKRYYEIIRL